MFFVGRKNEIRLAIKTLERNANIIITGKYGMGRTALARQIADIARDRWHFVKTDFSRIASRACLDIFDQLFSLTQAHKKQHHLHYKPMRFRIANSTLHTAKKPVIVLDNIEKLPPRRLDFIRYIAAEEHFQFVAITESFLPPTDFIKLRTILMPSITINLGRLGHASALEFFRYFAPRCGWTKERIKSLSEITNGYPLMMMGAVKQACSRKSILL
jgi:MoxR-like ATPase